MKQLQDLLGDIHDCDELLPLVDGTSRSSAREDAAAAARGAAAPEPAEVPRARGDHGAHRRGARPAVRALRPQVGEARARRLPRRARASSWRVRGSRMSTTEQQPAAAAGAPARRARAVLQPRAVVARLQRARARAGRGREHAPARAGEVPRDPHVKPGRVRDGARGGSARPGRRRRRGAQGRRADRLGDDRQDRRRSSRRATSGTRVRGRTRSGLRSPSTASESSPARTATTALLREVDEIFQEQIFPVLTPLAVGPGRPFPYISNLSLSLAVTAARPRHGHGGVRAGRRCRRRWCPRFIAIGRQHVRPARGGHRAEPPRAVPGHGDHGARLLPRYA